MELIGGSRNQTHDLIRNDIRIDWKATTTAPPSLKCQIHIVHNFFLRILVGQ